jgi:UDP-N-acetyl-D-mannosaminuronic acid dehydrogenase
MPEHVVQMVLKALRNSGKDIKLANVAILGVTYKSGADDSRLSPAEPIIRKLACLGTNIRSYDPYCMESFGAKRETSIDDVLQKADCLVIVTDHPEFTNIDLKKAKIKMNDSPVIVDGRRIVNAKAAEDAGFLYYGIGLGNQSNQKLDNYK